MKLILFATWIFALASSEVHYQNFYATYIPEEELFEGKEQSHEITVGSLRQCSAFSSMLPWSFLVWYEKPRCIASALRMIPRAADGIPNALKCFTKIDKDACLLQDGRVISDGESATLYCFELRCDKGVLTEIKTGVLSKAQEPCALISSFDWFEGLGCVRLVKSTGLSWCQAREGCRLYRADLLKIDDLSTSPMARFQDDQHYLGMLWVGLKKTTSEDFEWTLGESVPASNLTWGSQGPNNPQNFTCIITKNNGNEFVNMPCPSTESAGYVCEKPVYN